MPGPGANKESPIKIICKDNLNKQNDLQYSIKPKKANAINQSNNSYYSRSKSQIQKQIFDIKSEIIQANNVPQNIIRLKNLGNTCYFNSGLQCILNCQFLTNDLINSKYRIESNNMELVCSFRKLLIDIKDNSSFISPHEVLNEFRKIESKYNNSYQHDSPEFLSDFLNALSSQLNKVNQSNNNNSTQYNINTPEDFDKKCKSKEDSIIKDLFYGHISNTYICNCNTKQINYEQFLLFHCPLNKIETTINCYHLNS